MTTDQVRNFQQLLTIGIFLNFFKIKEYQFRSTFFDNIIFLKHVITKMMPNFWQLAITPILKSPLEYVDF